MSRKNKLFLLISVSIIILTLTGVLIGIFATKPTITLDYGYSTGGRILNEPVIENFAVSRFSTYSPPRPTRTGYTFKGWYKDSAYTVPWVNGEDKVSSDITLYANWEKI
jgi:uncharacterized repeat protein (TIGR02543 family)